VGVACRQVARGPVALEVVGVALRARLGRRRVATAGQLQGGIVGEAPRAAGVRNRGDLAVGVEAVVEAGQRGNAQRVRDAAGPAGGQTGL
jgi:hypothetical protein